MARPSYGPEAKKRSFQLFAALLDYANDELDCNEAALDALRSAIQTHWQTERRFVVRTKVRFLEALTKLANAPLTGEQIKESLRRFEDFLEILDDNRPNKGGSEVWHFTLNLWHSRSNRLANLRQFEQSWEERRPQKSKQGDKGGGVEGGRVEGWVSQGTEEGASLTPIQIPGQVSGQVFGQLAEQLNPDRTAPSTPLPLSPNWQQLCRENLEAQQYGRLTINPLTVTDGMSFNLHELYLPLRLVERKRRTRREITRQEITRQETEGSGMRDADETEDSDNSLALEEFFSRLQSPGKQRIAIVGEPGAGKTTLLQKIATWLLEQQALPIWIALADLQGATLEEYLLRDWLKQVTRKIQVSPEVQEALSQQFRQGQVWLLLDAIDEMDMDAATALTRLARQLRGWIADAHVVLTCRSNVWDCGKNALDDFTVYSNLGFSQGEGNVKPENPDPENPNPDQVGQFIERWFQDRPELGHRLRQELHHPKRKRIKDAVKSPLRLALLCRTWSLAQGRLPHTKALLYQQFVETLYEWKQDRFPTTLAQRQQLNQHLGQVALQALLQPQTRFRLSHSFAQQAFAESLELMALALQLGWLNQVGVSTTTGERVYAFYHPTFHEYFAAQSVSNWRFFLDSAADFPVFHPSWREVILLWLGRTDVPTADKEAFIAALTHFDDRCGGFYAHRAYFLAVAGLAEFPQSSQAETLLAQVIEWRFGLSSPPLNEGARVALLQTDRQRAIAALEQFVQVAENPFALWQAAYTLGKTLDPGSPVAITTLARLIHTLQSEALRLKVIESLGRIDPGNLLVVQSLETLLASTQEDNLRRRVAYSLGKIQRAHPGAIPVLEQIVQTTPSPTLRRPAIENLLTLDPANKIALAALNATQRLEKASQNHPAPSWQQPDLSQHIFALEQRLFKAKEPAEQKRLAYRLALLQPGHAQAIHCLLQLLCSENTAIPYKRIVENLKEVLLDHQLPEIVSRFSRLIAEENLVEEIAAPTPALQTTQHQEREKLLWYCAQQLPYTSFFQAWCKP